eukprot:2646404-Karenia_brevis.AAC.1
MPPFDALSAYKQLIRDTAEKVRNLLLQQASHLQARDSLFATLARTVVRNDEKLALKLISVSRIAATHIGVKNHVVFLHNRLDFDQEVQKCRRKAISQQISIESEQDDDDISASKTDQSVQQKQKTFQKKSAKISFLYSLMRLWLPSKRVYAIGAITDQHGQ